MSALLRAHYTNSVRVWCNPKPRKVVYEMITIDMHHDPQISAGVLKKRTWTWPKLCVFQYVYESVLV